MKQSRFLKIISGFIFTLIIMAPPLRVQAENAELVLVRIPSVKESPVFKSVMVDLDDTISILRRYYNFAYDNLNHEEQVIFIYNGQPLNEEASFKSYGIKNKDTVVIANINSFGSCREEWMRTTKEVQDFYDQTRSLIDPAYRKETVKLQDLHRLNAKTRLLVHQRFVRKDAVHHSLPASGFPPFPEHSESIAFPPFWE